MIALMLCVAEMCVVSGHPGSQRARKTRSSEHTSRRHRRLLRQAPASRGAERSAHIRGFPNRDRRPDSVDRWASRRPIRPVWSRDRLRNSAPSRLAFPGMPTSVIRRAGFDLICRSGSSGPAVLAGTRATATAKGFHRRTRSVRRLPIHRSPECHLQRTVSRRGSVPTHRTGPSSCKVRCSRRSAPSSRTRPMSQCRAIARPRTPTLVSPNAPAYS